MGWQARVVAVTLIGAEVSVAEQWAVTVKVYSVLGVNSYNGKVKESCCLLEMYVSPFTAMS